MTHILLIPLLAAIAPAQPTIYAPDARRLNTAQLIASTAHVRALSMDQLRALVPRQSGLYFVGCPNCQAGRQEHQLIWNPADPDAVQCQYCKHRYPSAKYPENDRLRVQSPRGETHDYPYWEDASGYRYFFGARRDDLVKDYLSTQARNLALLYAGTGDKQHAQRAAAILQRFAEVFPNWCFHYDYPFRQKQIFPGMFAPEKYVPELRGARWSWWAYNDMPAALLETYDLISPAAVLTPAERSAIETNLFRLAADELMSFREPNSNMSPTMWAHLVRAGRILREPRYTDSALSRIPTLIALKFYYDGSWAEGAPSYARQTVRNLKQVVTLAGSARMPVELLLAEEAIAKMRLPNGRPAPMHDTWSTDRDEPLARSQPTLLPALGHGILGGGAGDRQWQAHLTWSGGYGHQHADHLSLLLFARGKELLSDLGYTHTRYRPWTLATVAHNTVVIDERNQNMQQGDGALLDFDTSHPRVQLIMASGERAYPQLAKLYSRTLISVDGAYLIDRFEVEGGSIHDYFLHGDADNGGIAQIEGPSTPIPPIPNWKPTANEGEISRIYEPTYAFGFLSEQRKHSIATARVVPVAMPQSLRVHFLAEAGDELITGANPSIRGAGEDDARLDQHQRGFFRARRHASKSTFLAVIEIAPGVTAVEAAPNGLRIRINDRTDEVQFAPGVVRIPNLNYSTKPSRGGDLKAIEDGWFVTQTNQRPPKGKLVRLITEDGWVYPFETPVRGALDWNASTGTMKLERFPHRSHQGKVRVEWRD
ncbi:MAG: heparinase II/III family protein [Acidobacteria bacterium]|nr:heparinase II/III family protein [Acidobacteriota bacterium]